MTPRTRRFIAEALALAISSIPYGMAIEMGLWGMTFAQSASIRVGGILPDLALGAPYAAYQAWVLRRANVLEGQWLRYWVADSFAFPTFQAWIYLGVLLVTWLWLPENSQATWWQVGKTIGTLAVTSPIGGWLFRICAAWFYRLLKVS